VDPEGVGRAQGSSWRSSSRQAENVGLSQTTLQEADFQQRSPPDPVMPDQEQLDDFLEALEKAGSPAKNPVLRDALGWDQATYEEVKAALVAKGIVTRGRGRSDSVSLAGAEPVLQQAAPARATRKAKAASNGTANLGFEAKLWLTADKLRNNMDAAEYKHVVLGLIFLKYISDSFEEHRAKLLAGEGDYEGANPEDPDEYKAENVFWVPAEARWSHLQANAREATIGKLVDDAMVAIERDNPRLKGVLPKDYARPALDKQRLGELIDVIATIELTAASEGEVTHRSVDLLGRVYEYFLTRFASAEGKNGGQFYTPS
jgi:type I restriction enzyme M protein